MNRRFDAFKQIVDSKKNMSEIRHKFREFAYDNYEHA